MLFMAEMRTNKLAVSPLAAASSNNASRDHGQPPAVDVADEPAREEEEETEEVLVPQTNAFSEGLRRFDSFQEYVVRVSYIPRV